MIRAPTTLVGQIAAYAVSGGAMTLLHSLSYWLMAEPLRLDPYLANTLAALVAGASGYLLHSRWTFAHTNRSGGGIGPQARYVVVSLVCYAFNSFWVWLFVHRLGFGVTLSILPMMLATPWVAFALNRWWTFSK